MQIIMSTGTEWREIGMKMIVYYSISIQSKVKAKAVPQHSMVAQGEEEIQIVLIHDLGSRWG
jgi:hypothetical protein